MRRRADDEYIFEDDEVARDGEVVRCPVALMDGVQRAIAGLDLGDCDGDDLAAFDVADHRCGFRIASDAARAAVRDARSRWIAEMRDAWRGRDLSIVDKSRSRKKNGDDDDDDDDDGLSTTDKPSRSTADPRAVARVQYDAMCERLRAAWRTPVGDFAEPDAGARPEDLALMRAHTFGAPGLPAASDPDVDPAVTMRGHLGELFERSQRQRDHAWQSYRDGLTNAWRGGRTDPSRAAAVEGIRERTIAE
jgi:hypothetical protein